MAPTLPSLAPARLLANPPAVLLTSSWAILAAPYSSPNCVPSSDLFSFQTRTHDSCPLRNVC